MTMTHDSRRTEATRDLAQRLVELCFTLPARTASLEDHFGDLSDRIARQANSIESLLHYAQEHRELLRGTLEKQECLERASRQQAQLSEAHYQQHVLDPLVRQVFPLIDDLHDVLEEGQIDLEVRTLLEALQAQLLALLASHGIEAFRSEPGESFDPSSMRPVRQVRVFQPKEDRTVSRVIKIGFRRESHFLRHQSVEVCVYRPPTPALAAAACTSEEV